jgi:hypothetical protein
VNWGSTDGKPLDGQNRFSEKVINDLQQYYGQVIRNNLNSEMNMPRVGVLGSTNFQQTAAYRVRQAGVSSTGKR